MDSETQRTQNIHTELPLDGDRDKAQQTSKACTVSADLEKGIENISNSLGQILDVLRGSTIAEESGNDVRSKFWATYKKVSNEYDGDFLDRATDDMAIILTFAGLFSAVNSTFIVGMQPNPGDTTNTLMALLIQVVANGSDAVNINNLPSSSNYYPSTIWMQTLSYASLSFSLLAAFGAVMGKQWLNAYKTAPGRGSLKDRGLQRQRKLDALEYWQLRTVLGTLLVLLQISLLLFGLSLSANMFRQEIAISSVIISTTAFGAIFYLATILVSVLRPDSPFQTPGSKIVGIIFKKFFPDRLTFTGDVFDVARAVRWILETSTNPEFVAAAAAMVPLVEWPPKVDVTAMCEHLCDAFRSCNDKLECVRATAHFLTQPVDFSRIYTGFLDISNVRNDLIRDAFNAGRQAWDQLTMTTEEEDFRARRKHEADLYTALRTMVVYGRPRGLSPPDSERLIWTSGLRWYQSDGKSPSCEEFDWLIDHLAEMVDGDNATETGGLYAMDPLSHAERRSNAMGDVLLALSAMHSLGSPGKQNAFIRLLIRCMGSTKSSRIRHAAIRATIEAREELATITNDSMPHGVDAELLDELSRTLLTAMLRNVIPTRNDELEHDHDFFFNFPAERELRYFQFIFALARNEEWCQRLYSHGHIERCISLADSIFPFAGPNINIYLVGILLRVDPSGTKLSLNPRHGQERWRKHMISAWNGLWDIEGKFGYVSFAAFAALVEATTQFFQDPDNSLSDLEPHDMQLLVEKVRWALVRLRRIVGQADDSPANTLLPTVEAMYDDLCHMNSRNGI